MIAHGHIISVVDTKGHVKGYIQNTGVDVKKQLLAKLSSVHLWAGQLLSLQTMASKLTLSTPLVSGEIRRFGLYLTESEQTPSAVGLNVLLDDEDKVEVAEDSCCKFFQVLLKKKSIATKTHPRNARHFKTFESDDHIEVL